MTTVLQLLHDINRSLKLGYNVLPQHNLNIVSTEAPQVFTSKEFN